MSHFAKGLSDKGSYTSNFFAIFSRDGSGNQTLDHETKRQVLYHFATVTYRSC
jgi:hypothetical protein